jgi:hypothetical protein
LLREKWQNKVDPLAQELYAILNTPFTTTNGQQTYNQPNPSTTSTFYNQWPNSTVPAIQITKGNSTLDIGGDGINLDGQPLGGTPTLVGITGDNSVMPVSLLGTILGGGGTTYTVAVYGKDPTTEPPSLTVTATQRNLDATSIVPAGTDVIVLGYPYGTPDPVTKIYKVHWILLVPTWL